MKISFFLRLTPKPGLCWRMHEYRICVLLACTWLDGSFRFRASILKLPPVILRNRTPAPVFVLYLRSQCLWQVHEVSHSASLPTAQESSWSQTTKIFQALHVLMRDRHSIKFCYALLAYHKILRAYLEETCVCVILCTSSIFMTDFYRYYHFLSFDLFGERKQIQVRDDYKIFLIKEFLWNVFLREGSMGAYLICILLLRLWLESDQG
jgi:hypothetical protein